MNRAQRIKADGLKVEPIEFFVPRKPYGFMSSFSRHPVKLIHPFTGKLVEHETGEHRFQAMKATSEKDYDLILNADGPTEAKDLGRSIDLRAGWGSEYGSLCWYVMCETVIAKAQQHPNLLKQLLATGDRALWEDSPVDDIWGIRHHSNYRGKNLLGRSWMYARMVSS